MWIYLVIAALLAVAIGVQVFFFRLNSKKATGTMKAVTGANIALLSALMLGMLWLAYSQAVK